MLVISRAEGRQRKLSMPNLRSRKNKEAYKAKEVWPFFEEGRGGRARGGGGGRGGRGGGAVKAERPVQAAAQSRCGRLPFLLGLAKGGGAGPRASVCVIPASLVLLLIHLFYYVTTAFTTTVTTLLKLLLLLLLIYVFNNSFNTSLRHLLLL